ncbi:MAG: hypothetical protein AB7F91_01015 [Parvularculaceae bacterium]|nr:hypothetical protein [Parvularculaceae bacterium]
MAVRTAIAFCALLIATPAFASDAMDKCVADTTALGADDPEGQCQCFVDAISDEDADAYAQISDWESEASDDMKEAGSACFPELQ